MGLFHRGNSYKAHISTALTHANFILFNMNLSSPYRYMHIWIRGLTLMPSFIQIHATM